MDEISKIIRKIKEYNLVYIKDNLIALKNNISFKNNLDSLFSGNKSIAEINLYCEIIKVDKHFLDNKYLYFIENLAKINLAYINNIKDLNNNINKIEEILYKKYSKEIDILFNNQIETIDENKNKIFNELIQIEDFVHKINKM